MKTIQCDLCKRILGKTVGVGMYSITTATYSPAEFYDSMPSFREKKEADICNECSSRICKAQNDEVDKIKSEYQQKV